MGEIIITIAGVIGCLGVLFFPLLGFLLMLIFISLRHEKKQEQMRHTNIYKKTFGISPRSDDIVSDFVQVMRRNNTIVSHAQIRDIFEHSPYFNNKTIRDYIKKFLNKEPAAIIDSDKFLRKYISKDTPDIKSERLMEFFFDEPIHYKFFVEGEGGSEYNLGFENFPNGIKRLRLLLRSKAFDISYKLIISIIIDVYEKEKTQIENKLISEVYKQLLAEEKNTSNMKSFSKYAIENIKKVYHNFRLNDFQTVCFYENIIATGISQSLKPNYIIVFLQKLLVQKFDKNLSFDYLEAIINNIKEDNTVKNFEEYLENDSTTTVSLDSYYHLDGIEFEKYLKKMFVLLKFEVELLPERQDQGGDLIISRDGIRTVVQAKKYTGNVGNKAIQEVVAARNFYRTEMAMVVTNSLFTKSANELAKKNQVELWDGVKLKAVIGEINNNKEN